MGAKPAFQGYSALLCVFVWVGAGCGLKNGLTAKGDPSHLRQRVVKLPVGKLDRSPIGGHWIGECVKNTDGGSQRYEYRMFEKKSLREFHAFEDGSCRQEGLQIITLIEDRPSSDGVDGYFLEITPSSVSDFVLLPSSSAAVKTLNQGQYCGIADWRLGEARSVKNTSCADPVGNDSDRFKLDPDEKSLTIQVGSFTPAGVFHKQ